MSRPSKQAKVNDVASDSDTESTDTAEKQDHITKNAGPDAVLMRCLADMIGSPYDWRFLQAASRGFRHVGEGSSSPLKRCRETYKTELGRWDAARVHDEACKELPDGDRVLFAVRMRHLLGSRNANDTRGSEKLLDALMELIKKHHVLGWPLADDNDALSLFRALDRLEIDMEPGAENEEEIDDDENDYNTSRLTDRGVVEFIVTIMERFPGAARVQEKGCVLLSKLWSPEDLSERCVLLTRSAMDVHLRDPLVQVAACRALKHFWHCTRDYLLSMEAVSAAVVAMETHPSSWLVQRAACNFLSWILPPSEESADKDAIEAILNTDAMKLVLMAVTKHLAKPRFQRDAWITISKMLCHLKNEQFYVFGGLDAMKLALAKYSSSRLGGLGCFLAGVSDFVFDVFRWACTHEKGRRDIDEALMEFAAAIVIRSRSVVRTNALTSCCKAFGYLAHDIRWAQWFSEKRLAEHIVKFMTESLEFNHRDGGFKSHQWRHPEYTSSMVALTQLVRLEPLQVDGALRVVLWAMSAVPEELDIQIQGCAFLASLDWNPLNSVKASAFRACNNVVDAMLVHAKEEVLQEQACLALKTLLVRGQSREMLAKHGGVGALVQAIETFPRNNVVQMKGREIIKCMSGSACARAHSNELRVLALFSLGAASLS
eukprot:TRINITY_DN24347_c0_g2_i1.p1 TRINITY_DN24347_c0_g2~~TRINITY_DN24347_c0_g2_i1.p1  ORF type:complete len:658 (+),score=84.97 TRINITY_DN24347_c0_g2_i1:54-2027(+)